MSVDPVIHNASAAGTLDSATTRAAELPSLWFRVLTSPRTALAAVFVLALVLRIWGIGFGLPYEYHVDEPRYVSEALNLGAGVFDRQPYPTGYPNILFGEYVLYLFVGLMTRSFRSLGDFERAYRADPSAFLLLSRATSVLLGSLTVVTVYAIGKTVKSCTTGLLSAVFMAVAFLHVRDSHFGVPDVAATFFGALCVLFCLFQVKSSGSGSVWRLYAAAAVAGLAIATKWNMALLLLPVAVALLASLGPAHRFTQTRPWARILLTLASLILGLMVGGFQLFLQPRLYLAEALAQLRAGEAGGFEFWQVDTVTGWHFYFNTLSYGVGPFMLALVLIGCFLFLMTVSRTNPPSLSLVLLSFPLLYLVLMGSTSHYFARYALPLIPFVAVFAAFAVITLTGRWAPSRPSWLVPTSLATLSLLAIAQPLANDIRLDRLLNQTDTRTIAKGWIEANIPEGARIALDWPTHGPPLSTPDKPQPDSQKQFDVVTIGGTGLSDHPLAWYREQHFDYVITSSFIADIPLTDEGRDAERKAFYDGLDRELALVAEFRATEAEQDPPFVFDEIYGPAISLWDRDRPGPLLKVYRVQ